MNIQNFSRILLAIIVFSLFVPLLAQLPTVNATTANLGVTTVGGASTSGMAIKDYVSWFGPFTATLTGLINSTNLYCYAGLGNAYARAAVYNSTAGHPGDWLGNGSEVHLTNGIGAQAWINFPGLNVSVTSGQIYYLAIVVSTNSVVVYTDVDAAYGGYQESVVYPAFPASYGGALVGTYKASIYATIYSNTITYSNVAVSNTFMGANAVFTTDWATDGELNQCVFAWNYTGVMVNETVSISGATDTASVTKTLPVNGSMNGDVIQWVFYASNTVFQWNTTGVQSFTLTSGNYFFTLKGVYDESTGALNGSCNVTAYFDGAAPETTVVNGEKTVGYASSPVHLWFDLSPLPREYWAAEGENMTEIYIYNDATTEYLINFVDYTGLLDTYPYVTAKVNVNGTTVTVEKCKVDIQNSVVMALVEGRKYTIEIGDASASYVYGDLLMTSTTSVQLTLRGVDFPKETLLMQKYVRIYGIRNFTSPSGITVTYQDLQNLTTSVTLSYAYQNGTVAYSTTPGTPNAFTTSWNGAENDTTYYLTATIDNAAYGTLTWKQTFLAQNTNAAPFSFSWLGSLPFDTSVLLPVFLIVLAAGCFSALNAEVGMVVAVIMAIVFAWLGWIPISGGAIVAALFLSVLCALIVNKRRVTVY